MTVSPQVVAHVRYWKQYHRIVTIGSGSPFIVLFAESYNGKNTTCSRSGKVKVVNQYKVAIVKSLIFLVVFAVEHASEADGP